MKIPFLIHDEQDYNQALELISELWGAEPGTPESQVLEVQSYLVDEYERLTSTLDPPNWNKLMMFKLRELGQK